MPETNPDIIIVEDDIVLGNTFLEIIEILDYTAQIIHNGEEAIGYLQNNVPDLILLDMHLPGVTGMDILNFIKGDKRFSDTKVIVVTADRILHQESQTYTTSLLKPISMTALIKAIESGLSADV